MDLKFPSFKHWSVTLLTNYSDHWNTQKFIFSPQSQLEKKNKPIHLSGMYQVWVEKAQAKTT